MRVDKGAVWELLIPDVKLHVYRMVCMECPTKRHRLLREQQPKRNVSEKWREDAKRGRKHKERKRRMQRDVRESDSKWRMTD